MVPASRNQIQIESLQVIKIIEVSIKHVVQVVDFFLFGGEASCIEPVYDKTPPGSRSFTIDLVGPSLRSLESFVQRPGSLPCARAVTVVRIKPASNTFSIRLNFMSSPFKVVQWGRLFISGSF